MFVAGVEQLFGVKLEVLVEQHGAVFYVVAVGTNAIHAVGGLDGNDVVDAWTCEASVCDVDSLVGAVTEEDMVGGYSFDLCESFFQLSLQRVWVSVVRLVVWVLVGIEKYVGGVAAIFIARTAIWGERQNVWTG